MDTQRLLVEMAVVGVFVAAIFAAIHYVAMRIFNSSAMTNHGLLFAQVAVAGALTHFLWEKTNLNAWYCSTRK